MCRYYRALDIVNYLFYKYQNTSIDRLKNSVTIKRLSAYFIIELIVKVEETANELNVAFRFNERLNDIHLYKSLTFNTYVEYEDIIQSLNALIEWSLEELENITSEFSRFKEMYL